MTHVVVDTDVFSFVFRNDSRKELYRSHLDGRTHVLSFMTVAELYQWAILRNWGDARKERLEQELQSEKYAIYRRVTPHLARLWAHVRAERRRKGKPIKSSDAWVAAVALRHAIPIVTHNGDDFRDIDDLEVICEPKP